MQMRKEIRAAFKSHMTWGNMKSENGSMMAVKVGRVEKTMYACLIGKKNDPGLTTLVKSGAWYSERVELSTLFGVYSPPRGSGGVCGCNSDLAIDGRNGGVEVKYSPSQKTISIKAWVCHIDQLY
eukprot:jgi/Bigna1/146638/aug1.118_g21346